MLVGKLHRVAHAHGLFEILAFVWLQKFDIAVNDGIGGVHIAVDLRFRALAQFLVAVDVDFRA